jgi:hypothetical protein
MSKVADVPKPIGKIIDEIERIREELADRPKRLAENGICPICHAGTQNLPLIDSTPPQPVGQCPAMARQMVWLEDSSFAAWGCSECNWILANLSPTQAKQEFDEHVCAEFPRRTRERKEPRKGPAP